MLLRRLSEYADRLPLPPTLYSQKPVRYLIELDSAGRPLAPEPADTASLTAKRGEPRLVPEIQRTAGVKPLLLADKADYVLGYAAEPSRAKRTAECHQAFVEIVTRCAQATGEPAVQAVLTFLQNEPLTQLQLPADFDPGATIGFRIDLAVFPTDLPAVQAFWAAEHAPAAEGAQAAAVMQCIVCGAARPVLDRLQGKIKGLRTGQTSGTAIISANAEAFESYGLEASLIAPTCATCGERFTKALNDLLASREGRLSVGGVDFVFWTRDPVGWSPYAFLTDPKPGEVQALIDSVRSGRQQPGVDETAFYATALTGSGGRTVVRDWLDTTIGEVKRNLAAWFERQSIIDRNGASAAPLGLFRLAVATVREAADLAPTTPRALLRGALQGTPLPLDLLFQCVRRNRAEQTVTQPRAALIKLVLLSQHPGEEEHTMAGLNPEHPNPAYHCGRLLAVLEEVQRAALPGVNATIVDRFFGTASSAPASVFGRLVRGAQPHLAKLERDRPGAWRALQARLEQVMARLGDDLPKTLSLEQQGLFALGYYHQRGHDRAEAIEASQRRKAAAGETTTEYSQPVLLEEGN